MAAARCVAWWGRYVPSAQPLAIPASLSQLISLENMRLSGTSVNRCAWGVLSCCATAPMDMLGVLGVAFAAPAPSPLRVVAMASVAPVVRSCLRVSMSVFVPLPRRWGGLLGFCAPVFVCLCGFISGFVGCLLCFWCGVYGGFVCLFTPTVWFTCKTFMWWFKKEG